MKFFFFVVTLLILLSGGSRLRSETPPAGSGEKALEVPKSSLVWDRSMVEMKAKLGEKIIRTTFKFTNQSENPISIVELTPSCACLMTELDKLDYAPGESGTLKVTLDLSKDEELSLQDRSILVSTSDHPTSPTSLRFLVHVPIAVEITPRELSWTRGEKPVAKEVLVKAGPGVDTMRLHLESKNGDFTAEIKPEIDGQSYRVTIAPQSAAEVCYAEIRLLAESASFPRPILCEIEARVAFEAKALHHD